MKTKMNDLKAVIEENRSFITAIEKNLDQLKILDLEATFMHDAEKAIENFSKIVRGVNITNDYKGRRQIEVYVPLTFSKRMNDVISCSYRNHYLIINLLHEVYFTKEEIAALDVLDKYVQYYSCPSIRNNSIYLSYTIGYQGYEILNFMTRNKLWSTVLPITKNDDYIKSEDFKENLDFQNFKSTKSCYEAQEALKTILIANPELFDKGKTFLKAQYRNDLAYLETVNDFNI